MADSRLKIKSKVYYARIHPTTGLYEVCDLVVQVIEKDYFAATDKSDKHRYLFSEKDIGTLIFFDRDEALHLVLEAEKNRPKKYQSEGDSIYGISDEI